MSHETSKGRWKPRWKKDAPDHYSAELPDGRCLSAWPQRSHWHWEVLKGDSDATVLTEGNEATLRDAKLSAERNAK